MDNEKHKKLLENVAEANDPVVGGGIVNALFAKQNFLPFFLSVYLLPSLAPMLNARIVDPWSGIGNCTY